MMIEIDKLHKRRLIIILSISVLIVFLLIRCNEEESSKIRIEHTESDLRTVDNYLKSPVVRPDLELPNLLDTEYDIQIMNADEWGLYFDIIRLKFSSGNIEIAIQDSIHPLPRKYEFRQYLNKVNYGESIDSLVQSYNLWSIKDTLNKNRIIDGGNLSIILREEGLIKLITWQNIARNETPDKRRVRDFYNQVWHLTNELIRKEHIKYITGDKSI